MCIVQSVLPQWAMRVLDSEELAQQAEALKPGAGRITKMSK